jgi:tetratricopeptide (TPR) repeat protein
MPRVASGDIGHAVTTEHWIRRRPESGPLVESGSSSGASPAPGLPRGFFGDEPDGQIGAAVVQTPFLRSDATRLDQAIGLLESATERRPEMLTWKLDLARGYYHAEHYDQAIETLQRVIAADPGSTDAWDLLGKSYGSTGQADRSIAAYEEAIRHNPHFAAADYHLALLYTEQGRAGQLLEMAKRVFADHPDDARVFGLVARARYASANDAAGALELVAKAKRLNPTLVHPYLLEAQIAFEAGETKRAEAALRGAIRADNNSAPAHLQLGIMLLRERRIDEAANALKRAVELEPENEQARTILDRLK